MPLTQEKIAKIREELSNYPEEEREEKLKELLSQLDPEELKELEGQQCVFCLISEGKIKSNKVYEDSEFLAVLDINPANKGHVLLFPKKHIQSIKDVDEYIFSLTKIISTALKDISEGVNVYIADGFVAGQRINHLSINIIPRYKDDKISFFWQSKKVSEDELPELKNKILNNIIGLMPKPKKEKTAIKYKERERIP